MDRHKPSPAVHRLRNCATLRVALLDCRACHHWWHRVLRVPRLPLLQALGESKNAPFEAFHYHINTNMKRALSTGLSTALIALALFIFAPSSASADGVFSGWDYTPSDTTHSEPFNFGGLLSTLPGTLNMYGFQIYVHSVGTAPFYAGLENPNGSPPGLGCTEISSQITGTGFQTITLASPVSVSMAGSGVAAIQLFTNSGCTNTVTGNGGWSAGGDGSDTYRIVYWAPIVPSNINTRIDTVTPADKSSISTSTPYTEASTGYINANDYVNGAQLNMSVKSNSQTITGFFPSIEQNLSCFFGTTIGNNESENPACGNIVVPISSPGSYSFSTTTPAVKNAGTYQLVTSITVPTFSLFGFNLGSNTLVSTTTSFLGAATTTADAIRSTQLTGIAALLGGATFTQDNCVFGGGSFDIGLCVDYLMVPQQSDIDNSLSAFKEGAMAREPWGYATRFVTILTASTTPTSLPSWTANVAISSTSYTTFSFNMSDMITGGANQLNAVTDPYSGLTLRQVVEPFIWLFIGISLLIIVFHDLMAMGHHKKGSPPSAK